ncbi:MAG: helicase-related protein [Parvibaculum sp.]|uniref:helicase-related protein n=1 Tax=Parvibaculum sp. TaxID=2024848 RepID=UPI002844BC21|nr:helicase-related protein [Parvibaculum sp.]MDR3497664.1 helicase-related protein [Parvibaculum sp.]
MSATPHQDALPTRRITAVLGPTNTGKTHLAIERMMAHASGMIGLPLRLLAREVYDRVVRVKGLSAVALITGEEKILPRDARYFICTVEAMPLDRPVEFLAVDEIQLAADRERGHTFTDRLLRARGLSETMMLGSETVRGLIQKLLPDTIFVSRPRFSELSWTGSKKLTRLPRRSAIVAFSADQVYAIAELIRRQRGGAAVVMGALSPRTRNAQVALYQSGDVDFLVATDAVGMGLNMDVDHVAFASTSKFDGHQHRPLKLAEIAQIAGRAGRHMNNGTFGVTGDASPLADDTAHRIENHEFDAEHVLQWRNPNPEFGSIAQLIKSLELPPGRPGLMRAGTGDDLEALIRMSQNEDVARLARSPDAIRRLWEVAQVPDFRKTMASEHAGLLARLYLFLAQDSGKPGTGGTIDEDWLAAHVDRLDRTDGDIDTLATRIAHVRTWTYVSNRADWLRNPAHWQERTREIEDKLSDALHERLTQRFIDRRTSVLMKRLRQKEDLMAAVNGDGEVLVEGEYVGRLQGFVFVPDLKAEGVHGTVLREASAPVIALEIAARAARLNAAADADIHLSEHGRLIWDGSPVAALKASDNPLAPRIDLIAGEELEGASREHVVAKLDAWMKAHVASVLSPLVALRDAEDVTGLARGIAFRLVENFGSLRREKVAEDVRSLDQEARGQLRKYGVRFGGHSIFMPALLKPAPARLLLTLWALTRKDVEDAFADLPQPPVPGLTSVPADPAAPEGFYSALGFRVCGGRAVRLDMLERVADLIRPVITARTYNGGFVATPAMMSLVGCSGEEFSNLLKGLGYQPRLEKVRPPKPVEKPVEAPKFIVETISGETLSTPAVTAPVETAPIETPPVETPPVETVAAEEAAIDAAAADVDAAPAAEGAAPAPEAEAEAELVEMEIWRPARRHKPAPRERHARRSEAAPAEGAAATAEGAPGEARRERHRRPRREKQGEVRTESQAKKPEGERGDRPARDNRSKDQRPNKDNRNKDNRHKGGPDRNKDRDKDRGGRGERREWTAAPPRREREVDPDSPFAALAVLKERVRGN